MTGAGLGLVASSADAPAPEPVRFAATEGDDHAGAYVAAVRVRQKQGAEGRQGCQSFARFATFLPFFRLRPTQGLRLRPDSNRGQIRRKFGGFDHHVTAER